MELLRDGSTRIDQYATTMRSRHCFAVTNGTAGRRPKFPSFAARGRYNAAVDSNWLAAQFPIVGLLYDA
jgi:hypothetical protein